MRYPTSHRVLRWGPALWLLACGLGAAGPLCQHLLAQNAEPPAAVTTEAPSPVVTNATEAELASIQELFARLNRSVAAHDATALRFFGVVNFPVEDTVLAAHTEITHVAVSRDGALVRQSYEVTGAPDDATPPATLGRGVHELWLTRARDNTLAFGTQHWASHDDAVAALSEAAHEEWDALPKAVPAAGVATEAVTPEAVTVAARASVSDALGANGQTRAARLDAGATATAAAAAAVQPLTVASQMDRNGVLLHLVAMQRGGRWLALRRSRWNGALLDQAHLAQTAAANEANGVGEANVGEWLRRQMARFPAEHSGIVHFLLQRGARGWVGLGAAAEPNPHFDETLESAAAGWRREILGTSYFSPVAHRDFGLALSSIGLYSEAADEMEKAEALQPGLVGAAGLSRAREMRPRDLQAVAAHQLQDEAQVGLGPEHPAYTITALLDSFNTQPAQRTPLNALRVALEYSKLADDAQASFWLGQAQVMLTNGGLQGVSKNDAGWINVLYEHLQDRKRLAPVKPPVVLRSALFTVRCWPNDLGALKLLAALDKAQHTVYADFGIPMGSTEVVLWHNQREFQDYTSRFSEQATSEFVAALTLTKLISTQEGPVVLAEEINVFIDPRADAFSTVAHEYGHVAVRHLSRGRLVPVWFNEGIACAVEGGYDGYLPRVRRASRAGHLLGMRDLELWDVDGEPAFLAYSEANSLIDFIVSNPRWGRGAILEILRQIGRDVPPERAFRNVLAVAPQQLWTAWADEGIR